MNTFESIIKSKTLWLTDLTKSNDKEEVVRLYQNVWTKVVSELKKTDIEQSTLDFLLNQLSIAFVAQIYTDIPYGCCFCTKNDLSHMWREYGDDGRGVSLGFDLDSILGLKRQYPSTSIYIENAIGYEAVLYDSNVLVREFTRIFYSAIKQQGKSAWIMTILPTFKHYAGFIKNPSFVDEKEIRIVYYPHKSFEETIQGLGKREETPKPHYCLPWATDTQNALRSITIGYGNTSSENDIRALLNQAGLDDSISITYSECSYRPRI